MRRILVLLFALALAACATGSRPPPIAEQMAALQQRLFLIVEEKRHRLEARAKPLMFDPYLTTAAQTHAEAMAKAHTMDRKEGEAHPAIKALMTDRKFQGFVSVNVGQQFYYSRQGIDVDKFAQTFLDLWLNDTDHKWNITFYGFDRTGIGVATDGKAIFVSEIFATDLGLPPPPDDPEDEQPAATGDQPAESPSAPPPEAPPSPAPKP